MSEYMSPFAIFVGSLVGAQMKTARKAGFQSPASKVQAHTLPCCSMVQQKRTYQEYLEERCRRFLDSKEQFRPFPSSTLNVVVREAQRGLPCSLCDRTIPMEPEVDPHPQEYEWPSGNLMRFHGLLYSGAPDQRTSCFGVWMDVSRAWGKRPSTPRGKRRTGRSQGRHGRR
jgi:hypothetical protein